MKTFHCLCIRLLVLALIPGLHAVAQETGYENRPVHRASQLLQLPYLAGPHHKVRDEVVTDMGINRFVIDSDYGTFVASGNSMLEDRVKEINAMARLDEMSKSREYGDALKEAAKAPVRVVENLIDDPVETLSKVPKGIGKFMNRVSRGIKEVKEDKPRSQYEDDRMKSLLGVSRAKRELCERLGINPYSSNEILQQKLDDMGWVVFAGKMTVTAATLPIGGGVRVALTGTSIVDQTTRVIYDRSPTDVRSANLGKLLAMGIPERDAEAFLGNAAFSPWHQSWFVAALESMPGVKGRDVLVRDAAGISENESDAIFYSQTARLMAQVNEGPLKLDRIMLMNGFPVCLTMDGTVVVALHWDYAAWTPLAERFADALQAIRPDGNPPRGLVVALTGMVSPRLRQELEARGFQVSDRLIKGPLN